MIQSTCDQCGATFDQPKKPGRRRKRCDGCRPGRYVDRQVKVVVARCEQCGQTFESKAKPYLRKYCSEACRVREWRRRNSDKLEQRRIEQRATSCRIYVDSCDICGELKTWRAARKVNRWCSADCKRAAKAAKQRERYATKGDSERERIYAWRRSRAAGCVDCGAGTASASAIRCGQCQRESAAKSAGESHRRRSVEATLASWRRWNDSFQACTPIMLPPGAITEHLPPRHFVGGSCATCGDPFVVESWSGRYCSSRCAPGWKKWISRRVRFELYERDGWTCQICGEGVPIVVSHLHPLGASLDHIVPRSRGGGDAPANLRMAHMICNSLRGAPETGAAA